MCINPIRLRTGQLIGCRNCWQCKEQQSLDWVGRCIAESKTSVAASVVTFTYGGGDREQAAVLTYSDVQKAMKRFRKAGYPLKFLVAGEYGEKKGRAHWHAIIYWQRKVYPHVDRYGQLQGVPHGKEPQAITGEWDGKAVCYKRPPPSGASHKNPVRFWDPQAWPEGHMVWDEPNTKAIRYATKYIRKAETTGEQYYFSMSKKPPLGHEYFQSMAKDYVRHGLAPQTLKYGFKGVTNRAGKPLRFMMKGVTADNFLQAYVFEWWLKRPNEHIPNSEVVEEYLDRRAAAEREYEENWRREWAERKMEKEAKEKQDSPEEQARREFRARHYAWYFGDDNSRLFDGRTDFDGEEEETEKPNPWADDDDDYRAQGD